MRCSARPRRALRCFAELTADVDALVFVGVPVRVASKLYNCAAVLCAGELLGLVPKRNIPTYGEFYEGRRFSAGPEDVTLVSFAGYGEVPFGSSQLFECDTVSGLIVAAEICEDLWVPNPPSTAAALAGATLVVNLSASNELVGKADYRRGLVSSTSARLVCAYAYASGRLGRVHPGRGLRWPLPRGREWPRARGSRATCGRAARASG